MTAYIYLGGMIRPEGIEEAPGENDLVIAADSGYENAKRLGITPAVALGDFDSYDESLIPSEVKKIPFPPKKDYTDSQLAVEYAIEQGCTRICLIGGISGRLDHTLSNLAILENLWDRKIRCVMTDGFNRVRFLRNDSEILPRSPHFRYFGLLAADERLRGVEIDGCKYPLKHATLSRKNQFAVSNEIEGNCAFIAVRRGGIWIVESN
jgi:thiamine pyrophosphokinase